MIETWRKSYFETPGLRLFRIVPRDVTDQILPIEISPKPQELVRVLVGRSEILSHAFEQALVSGWGEHSQPRVGDRFIDAYRQGVLAMQSAKADTAPPAIHEHR